MTSALMTIPWRIILTMALAALSRGEPPCLEVAGDPVRASDLAREVAEFGRLAPGTPVAPAPALGVRRVVGPKELSSWAARAGLTIAYAGSVCIMRKEEALDGAAVEAAVAAALAEAFGKNGDLEWSIVSVRPRQAPRGELHFSRWGLSRTGAGLGAEMHTWRGRLTFDDGRHSVPVYVSLRLTRKRILWDLTRDLSAGSQIEEGDLARREIRQSPVDLDPYPTEGDLTGRRLRRALAKGATLLRRDLEPVYVVERGSLVTAQVDVGGARIAVPAVAQTNAQEGQRVWLRNSDTKKPISGRAAGDGRVQVDPASDSGGAKRGSS